MEVDDGGDSRMMVVGDGQGKVLKELGNDKGCSSSKDHCRPKPVPSWAQ